MVCFLNQTLLTLGFLKAVFLGLSFFSSSLMMYILPFVIVRLSLTPPTYADDAVIFTSSRHIDVIQSNLSQDLDNLSYRFRDNELFFNLKKGKSGWCCSLPVNGWICFKAVKSSSRSMVHPSTPLHAISTSACIWTRRLILTSIS